MADAKITYRTSQSFTITLNSLSSSATAGRESTAVSNTTNLDEDAIVQVKVTLAAGTPANDKCVYVYAYGAEDGSTYTDNATGSDAAVTLRSPTCLKLLSVISTPDSGGVTYQSSPIAVAQVFGGILPRSWGIVVRNYTGVALAGSGNSATYSGVYRTVA